MQRITDDFRSALQQNVISSVARRSAATAVKIIELNCVVVTYSAFYFV